MRHTRKMIACGLVLALAGVSSFALAQDTPTTFASAFSADSIEEGLREFLGELQSIASFSVNPDSSRTRRMLATDMASILSGWQTSDLFLRATESFSNVREFFTNLGERVMNFDWAALRDPANFQVLTSLFPNDFHLPTSLEDAELQLQELEQRFCRPAEIILPPALLHESEEKPVVTCLAPQFRLDLTPLVCRIDTENREITCTPPQLVMRKWPGVCFKKFKSPIVYIGKDCKLVKVFGELKNVTKGGDVFTHIIKRGKDIIPAPAPEPEPENNGNGGI